MINLFNKCPACGGSLVVTECRCTSCNLQLRGEFQPGRFSRLSEEQLAFVRVFLNSRGNLSEVEKVLGVSYPTIRNKLDEINSALEDADGSDTVPVRMISDIPDEEKVRRDILQQVADGKLSADEAIQKLESSTEEKS